LTPSQEASKPNETKQYKNFPSKSLNIDLRKVQSQTLVGCNNVGQCFSRIEIQTLFYYICLFLFSGSLLTLQKKNKIHKNKNSHCKMIKVM
jgi:hypothetical protein